jgi:hypothetical protein
MRTKNLIKSFNFGRDDRLTLDLTGGLRLNPGVMGRDVRARLELPRQVSDTSLYSTAQSLFAATRVTNPLNVKEWSGFEAVINNRIDPDGSGAVVTSAFYRLSDGSAEYWWDGGAWVVNNVDWNTEAEVANNITSFPVASRSLSVIVNLRTADARVSPELYQVKVLYKSDIDHHEDYLLRSFMPALKEGVRPIGRALAEQEETGVELCFGPSQLETAYEVVDVDAVFNEDDDPNHLVDLFDSYDADTGIITLNTSVDVGSVMMVRFTYKPLVALSTSRDYIEAAKVPAIHIVNTRFVDMSINAQDDTVLNKDTLTGVRVLAPRQGDIELELIVQTEKQFDQMRLAEELRTYFAKSPLMRSRGLDEEFRLWLIGEYSSEGAPNASDLQTGRLRCRIVNALFFERGSETVFGVGSFSTQSGTAPPGFANPAITVP